jgi:hypothetical protein
LVPLIGVTENPVPLHVEVVIAFIEGVGFNVTVTVKVPPVQVPEIGVTV